MEASRRKKQPLVVRQQLLDVAADVAIRTGPVRLTLDAVAAEAGVSKGGLLHHFPSKQALLQALFEGCVASLERRIEASLADDDVQHGRFTRAYVRTLTSTDDDSRRWDALGALLTAEPELNPLWTAWLNAQLIAHAATDSTTTLSIVRLAADGVWMSGLVPGALEERERAAVIAQLLTMTQPSTTASR